MPDTIDKRPAANFSTKNKAGSGAPSIAPRAWV
jgi:hypothetical protein